MRFQSTGSRRMMVGGWHRRRRRRRRERGATAFFFRLPPTKAVVAAAASSLTLLLGPPPAFWVPAGSMTATVLITAGTGAAASAVPPSATLERVLEQVARGEESKWELIGQGASGKAYRFERGDEGQEDWVIKLGEGEAAGRGLRRECGLLQRLEARGAGTGDAAGLERCLGVSGVGKRTVEVLSPYLEDDAQLDSVEASLAGAYVRLLIGEVGLKGGVALSDVQVLKNSGGRLLLIDLTEGWELSSDIGTAANEAAVARAFVAEVCGFIDADSAEAQRRAAEALLAVLREARDAGDDARRSVSPALLAAVAEAPLPLAPAAVMKDVGAVARSLMMTVAKEE